MMKGPGLFPDIGKKARDLLYKDYHADQKFVITTVTASGVALKSSGTKKGDLFLGDLSAQLRNDKFTADLRVDTSSTINTTLTYDDVLAKGIKTSATFSVPDQKSGKVEVQYFHEHVGISSTIGLTATPLVEASLVAGAEGIAVGGDIALDTTTSNITKYNAGVSFSKPDFVAAVNVTDKLDTIKASYIHLLDPATKTSVAAEASHCLSAGQNTFTLGFQHALDPLTTVKGRVNNYGKVAGLVQHEWRPRSLITISGEVDSKALESTPKVGLSLAVIP